MRDIDYPRPQFVRKDWQTLNGAWSYSFNDSEDPTKVNWQGWIQVPYPPESPKSGLHDHGYHPVIWYQRRFEIPDGWRKRRIILHFGAVDYRARVWLNGRYVIEHEGGHTPFSVDITEVVVEGEQILTVRAEDDPLDMEKPRGKQDWEREPHKHWYPRTTGIWQTVWLEPIFRSHIDSLRVTPDVPGFGLEFDINIAGLTDGAILNLELSLGEHKIVSDRWNLIGSRINRWVALPDPGADAARRAFLWRPEHPTLFDLTLTLWNGERIVDQVESYTALRSIETHNRAFYLNGRPYFLQMVVDQGYWPESHLAAPSAEALKREVELAKSMGFNGVRKHQKIEDPRYFYWADRLGLLVWAEMPSFYNYSARAAHRSLQEFAAMITRDFNHPSIIAWVPFNKSWGVSDLQNSPEQQHFVQSMYHLAKSLDPTRLVVDNDGWEHIQTDLVTIHDFLSEPELLSRRYGTYEALSKTISRRPIGREVALNGSILPETPVVLSEFGGFRYQGGEGLGIRELKSPEEFLEQLAELFEAVSGSALAGFCYAQLADTFQEKTGLLDENRQPKIEPEAVARLLRTCVKRRAAAEI